MPLKASPSAPSPLRILCLALAAWAVYYAARTAVQRLLPVSDLGTYLEQDAVLSVLRLAGLGFCYWLGRLRYSREQFQNLPGRPALAWSLGLALTLTALLSYFARDPAPFDNYRLGARMVELGIAVIVAAFEEVGWRGVLFEPIREIGGPRWALGATAAGFTLMHVGYQPWSSLPGVALLALALGLARLRGLSLGSLILIHFSVDAALALYLPEGPVVRPTLEWAASLGVGASALAVYFVKPRPQDA